MKDAVERQCKGSAKATRRAPEPLDDRLRRQRHRRPAPKLRPELRRPRPDCRLAPLANSLTGRNTQTLKHSNSREHLARWRDPRSAGLLFTAFAFSATGSGSGSPAVTEVRTVVTSVAASPGARVRLSVCPGGGAPTWSRGQRCQGWGSGQRADRQEDRGRRQEQQHGQLEGGGGRGRGGGSMLAVAGPDGCVGAAPASSAHC